MVLWLTFYDTGQPIYIPGLWYTYIHMCTRAGVLSRVQLCDRMDCSLPGSSVCEISQIRILEWVAISSSRGSSWPRDWASISCISKQILYHWATWEAPFICMCVCGGVVTSDACDPMECSPLGSSVHEISQIRILKWAAISSLRLSSKPRDAAWVSCIAGGVFTDWATREAHMYIETWWTEVLKIIYSNTHVL